MLPDAPPNLVARAAFEPTDATRSQWEHIGAAPDVELYVRRPPVREQNRKVERLLKAARAIHKGEPVMTISLRTERKLIRAGARSIRYILMEVCGARSKTTFLVSPHLFIHAYGRTFCGDPTP